MTKLVTIFLAFGALATAEPAPPALTYLWHGKVHREWSETQLREISPMRVKGIWVPGEAKPIALHVVRLHEILTTIGSPYFDAESFEFRSRDGKLVRIPRRKLDLGQADLASTREDGTPFATGQWRVVWEDEAEAPDPAFWIDDVVSIDLIGGPESYTLDGQTFAPGLPIPPRVRVIEKK